jgi:isocitrate/isopropylmalate dehydrogenase
MSPSATSRKHSIATIGADGIGPEVIEAGVQVLRQLVKLDGTFALDFVDYDWSSETYKRTGQYIPDGGLEQLKKHNAILFGAVGAPGMFRVTQASTKTYMLTIAQTCLITSHYGTCV